MSKITEAINTIIKHDPKTIDTNEISDGYHTFGELYEHRCLLFIYLCTELNAFSWKSRKHSDGSEWAGWFILGLYQPAGIQITYHIPERLWNLAAAIPELKQAPEWDGHTSADVIDRLEKLIKQAS